MIPKHLKVKYKVKSGDKVVVGDKVYTSIDNHSNCSNFTNEECVEILSETRFKKTMKVKKGQYGRFNI